MSQQSRKSPLVLISGGGTGGHIFPALAVAEAIRARRSDVRIAFVGAIGRMEMELIPKHGYEIYGLPIMGMPRGFKPMRLARFLLSWKLSNYKARRLLRRQNPDAVVGVGGYASAPIMAAAQKAEVPTLLIEPNGYAGKANQWLARRAKAICVAYPNMSRFFPAEKIVETGTPIRGMILKDLPDQDKARRELGLPQQSTIVLIIGGSLGAGSLNQTITENLSLLSQHPHLTIMLQTGKSWYKLVHDSVEGYEGSNLRIMPFIDRMDLAYAVADLIVSRAGANAVAELAIVGKPVIFVPSPNVAEDHQTKNAMGLAEHGAAIVVKDADAVEKLLPAIISLRDDHDRRASMAVRIKSFAKPDAADHIARLVLELCSSQSSKQAR